ncbi:MAG TPA: response regulator [Mucilaginibacter sp.]|jgi:DNA-binding response OmpR family regulator
MLKRIVIIEDDKDLLMLLGRFFRTQGFHVTCLESFTSMEALIALNADCFILDEHLPYVSGHILCILLKSNTITKDIPVVLISGYEGLEGFVSICKANASLQKPFETSQLLKIVSGLTSAA